MSFWDGFEKRALVIDPGTMGAIGGLTSGYSSGRSAAGATANALSREGTKTKNEEMARTLAKLIAPVGAGLGLGLGFKHKEKLVNFLRNRISDAPELQQMYHGVVPFLSGTAGGVVAGAGTGALASLRGRFGKKKGKE